MRDLTSYPDRENTMSLLGDWQKHHAAINKMMCGINQHMGLDPDGSMFVTVWAVFGAYTDSIAAEIGDYFGWLDWYRFETGMGQRSKEVQIDGKTKRIKTLANLCTVILERRCQHDDRKSAPPLHRRCRLLPLEAGLLQWSPSNEGRNKDQAGAPCAVGVGQWPHTSRMHRSGDMRARAVH
jgi:hypothetical protein